MSEMDWEEEAFRLAKKSDGLTAEKIRLEKENDRLKSEIDAKNQRIKQHEQLFREDEERYSEIVSTNRRLHEENIELKNDIVHLIRESRKGS